MFRILPKSQQITQKSRLFDIKTNQEDSYDGFKTLKFAYCGYDKNSQKKSGTKNIKKVQNRKLQEKENCKFR